MAGQFARTIDRVKAAVLDLRAHLAWRRFSRLLELELRYRYDQPRARGDARGRAMD